MYCFQCQEALKNEACTTVGVCGKTNDTSDMQDLLIRMAKGVGWWANKAMEKDIRNVAADKWIIKALFTTVTNVSFDNDRIMETIQAGVVLRDELKAAVIKANGGNEMNAPDAAEWNPSPNITGILEDAGMAGVLFEEDADIRSLKELVMYGMKGAAAYMDHSMELGANNTAVIDFFKKALSEMLREDITLDELVALTLECGNQCVAALALLDEANTSRFGHQEATTVPTGLKSGPGILVTGHDLIDMEELLKQTEGKGINIYTHSEMLTTHAYPELKKYSHLVGNFGGAWHEQQKDFAAFDGAILFTTNCIQKPLESYKNRVFTTGNVAWPELIHIADREEGKAKDFTLVIESALAAGDLQATEGSELSIGFARNQVMAVADKVVEAVKSGAITRFVVMAGCDARQSERAYFTKVAEQLPDTAVILTAGCAKYRYNHLELGDIGGIPRLLDAGQCNDSYSLAYIALQLKEVFEVEDINDLPIEFDIAWYEQKAVCVLLALIALGFKGVRIGPTLPAFLSPNVANLLIENFGLQGITTPENDVKLIMGTAS